MTKRLFCFMLLTVLSAQTLPAQEARPKVGLVLSGGGARGLAHIPVLKMLDSLAIPVDVIAGTSMGGIMGAFYAAGYSGEEIEAIARSQDWPALFSDKPPRHRLPYPERKRSGRYQLSLGIENGKLKAPSGLIQGQNIQMRFAQIMAPYNWLNSFDDMPIPYRTVASDLNSCDAVTLEGGNVIKAMRSTMSIPTAFSPVAWDDSLFIDGGMLNNYPVDVARAAGADRIIGVDVMGSARPPEPARTIVEVLNRTLAFLGVQQWRDNVAASDIYISPKLHDHTIMDFLPERIDGILACGDTAAWQHRNELIEFRDRYGLIKYTQPENGRWFVLDSLRVHGLNRIRPDLFTKRLGLKKGQRFNLNWLDSRITTIRASTDIDTIAWEVVPCRGEAAQLRLRVKETVPPLIDGIQITGQETLPFGTIYRQLNIKPGEMLDTRLLGRRIMELYGLGYFEAIDYSIIPVEPGWVRLEIVVREKPRRQLLLGVRWDSFHKLKLGIGATVNNVLLPGLRIEHDLLLAGINYMKTKIYYPSRTLNLPVYPQIGLEAYNARIAIYDENSNQLAQYRDKAASVSFGLGLLLGHSFNLSACYQMQWMAVEPDVAMPDPVLFPTWNDRLYQLVLNIDYDSLDDMPAPRNGLSCEVFFEGSYEWMGAQQSYRRGSLAVDWYKSFNQHTFRTHLFVGRSSSDTPIYKAFNRGLPQYAAGFQRDQIFASSLNMIRLDYQHWFKPYFCLKAVGNVILDYGINSHLGTTTFEALWGHGVGFQLVTPLGQIEGLIAKGDKNWIGPRKWQTVAFLSVGAAF